MADIFTKKKRSEIMSKISGKETKPEILVRKFLFANGFRYRKNDKRYPGKPDIVLPKYKTVIFVHGCFWHGHNCPAGKLPETRKEFWKNKIQGNIERDNKNKIELEKKGWRVITIWQCELKNKKIQEKTLINLTNTLHNNVSYVKPSLKP
ncbi:MAG: DNA mismatch endonuclease Vsr [Chlorobi bacterium]|nr:DNA mismatch endonuclease Vsr [Chlorobiota bacterium]